MMISSKVIAEYVNMILNERAASKIWCSFDEKDNLYSVKSEKAELKFPLFPFWKKEEDELINAFSKEMLGFLTVNGCDIPGTIFFFLSGFWEYMSPNYTDDLGRYLGKESFSYKVGCIDIPVVDVLINQVFRELDICKRRFYQNPKFCITHDIDYLKRSQIKPILRDIIRNKNISQAARRIGHWIRKYNPYDLGGFLEKEIQQGLKPICFMLNTVQKENTDGGYLLEKEKNAQQVLKERGTTGFGIHYDTEYLETRFLGNIGEIEKFTGKSAIYGRAHYLIFDLKKSFEIYDEQGIAIDFSGGYRDVMGFRFGTSLPFHPFNFKNNSIYKVLEVPLIVMDGTWVSIDTRWKNDESKKEAVRRIIGEIRKTEGLFTVLWHNTSVEYDVWRKYERWYWGLLKELQEKGFTNVGLDDLKCQVDVSSEGN